MTIKPKWDAKSAGEYERSLTLRDIKIEDDDDIQDYKKPWVGLTDEEAIQVAIEIDIEFKDEGREQQEDDIQTFARAIEAKLKDKNGY